LTNITIPPEAVRAAKVAWADNGGPTSDDDMAAAIRAALAAWPGMSTRLADTVNVEPRVRQIILPLPQE